MSFWSEFRFFGILVLISIAAFGARLWLTPEDYKANLSRIDELRNAVPAIEDEVFAALYERGLLATDEVGAISRSVEEIPRLRAEADALWEQVPSDPRPADRLESRERLERVRSLRNNADELEEETRAQIRQAAIEHGDALLATRYAAVWLERSAVLAEIDRIRASSWLYSWFGQLVFLLVIFGPLTIIGWGAAGIAFLMLAASIFSLFES